MTPISVVIITFNEERNIAECIDAVKSIADEIIIVDSFSTDKTVEIAENRGARVVKHKFEGHIQQKNYAITQAKYMHIFSLDADEHPDEKLVEEIKKIKQNWIADGYSFNRLNNYCGTWIKHGAWYPDIKLRLWDSCKGMWDGMNPHDKFVMQEGSVIQHLEGNLLHYSYKTVSEHREKINYFSSIAAESYFLKGKTSSVTKIIFSPVFRFLRDYILKLGFLEGKFGFTIAWLSAIEVKLKYEKLLQMQNRMP